MAAKDSHGVVVVRVSTSVIHEPSNGHGDWTFDSDDWELFPNRDVAKEADYRLCEVCFYRELQQQV